MEMFDKIIDTVTENYLVDIRGNKFYVGDVCAVAQSGVMAIGVVCKIFTVTNSFSMSPYNKDNEEKYYPFNFEKKRFFPQYALNISPMMKIENKNFTEETTNIVDKVVNKKVFYRYIYAVFQNIKTNEVGISAFKIHSKEGKRFVENDAFISAKEIENKYPEFKFKWFYNGITFEELNNKNHLYITKVYSYGFGNLIFNEFNMKRNSYKDSKNAIFVTCYDKEGYINYVSKTGTNYTLQGIDMKYNVSKYYFVLNRYNDQCYESLTHDTVLKSFIDLFIKTYMK